MLLLILFVDIFAFHRRMIKHVIVRIVSEIGIRTMLIIVIIDGNISWTKWTFSTAIHIQIAFRMLTVTFIDHCS